jgi:lysophospholipase L1-like esterase
MKSSATRILRRSGALALGLLVALLLAEGAYRVLRAGALGPTTNPAYVRADPDLGWAYRPGARARHSSAEFDVQVRIHERGFRGEPWQLEGDERRRLLLLGDSFAFGWGVEEDAALGARVQALLPAWQVLNAGVSGYGTGQQLLVLEALLASTQPDAVAVVFCANDLFESGAPVTYGARKPFYRLTDGELELHGQPVRRSWLERKSQLYRAWKKQSWERRFAHSERDPAAEWALTRALFRAMRARLSSASRAGHPPPLILLSETDELAQLAASEDGIEHVDLRPTLTRAGPSAHFPQDGHWTPRGHELVGRALATEFVILFGAD